MEPGPSIQGVVVTQNTSQFTELMLRTLFLRNDPGALDLSLTVLDNGSAGPEHEQLCRFLDERAIPLIPTGFPPYVAAELHGAALERFVQEHAGCSHYLFLDADMWFVEPDTLGTMQRELGAAGTGVFAVQARIFSHYHGLVYEGREGVAGTHAFDLIPTWPIEFEGRTYANRYQPRLSPVCCLVRNTPLFRRIVEVFGLTQAIRFGVREVFYHDTFSLMTQIMATHGQRFIVSARTIHHFTQTTYKDAERTDREADCARMLEELRSQH